VVGSSLADKQLTAGAQGLSSSAVRNDCGEAGKCKQS
jgi:hypothetical protein